MPSNPDELLRLQLGESTVGENLQRAIESGVVRENGDGTWELAAQPAAVDPWLRHRVGASPPCRFLSGFLFAHVYAQSAVPKGCEGCYKVKVAPRTVRELVALWGIAQRIACNSKCGLDIDNKHSQSVYAGYFYVDGLDAARQMFRVVREATDLEPKLGSHVPVVIKRGCSHFEAACGPSDQYTFRPELQELETFLKGRFKMATPAKPDLASTLFAWIDTAYRIGDDTYLDLTGGRPFRTGSVTYSPVE